MNNSKEHQKLVDDLLFAFGSKPNIRIWKRVVGFDDKRKIAFGIPGESDLDGIVAPRGRRLAIECKTGAAVLSDKQKLWRDMIIRMGGIYILARSTEQALTDFNSQL